ncbi:hypothetical protein GSB9_02519 [Flavobacteriaceae bacterium GSB9]|nr:hypothetical protein GSB9_02519 [Flavobacteriaceae bacterium GSB9]
MKSLKITLIAAAIFASLVSCTKQDLTEDDVLKSPDVIDIPITGGGVDM